MTVPTPAPVVVAPTLAPTGRPAFSYLVLGALRGWGDADRDGQVSAEEAVRYAGTAMRVLVKSRTQTPQVHGEGAAAPLVKSAGEAGPDLAGLVLRMGH